MSLFTDLTLKNLLFRFVPLSINLQDDSQYTQLLIWNRRPLRGHPE